MSDTPTVAEIRARRERERDVFHQISEADAAGDRVLVTQLLNASAGTLVDYEADVDFLLAEVERLTAERDILLRSIVQSIPPGGYRAARGAFNWDGEPAEETVRRLRDGDAADEVEEG